jgi:long-chain acyl-CoA synthetase
VPRVFIKTYSRIKQSLLSQPFYKRWLFSSAYNRKFANMKNGKKTPWTDKLVFGKIQAMLGGKLKILVNGAAICPKDVMDFLGVCFGTFMASGMDFSEDVYSFELFFLLRVWSYRNMCYWFSLF